MFWSSLKYILWVLSTGLAFAGAWLFKFTQDDLSRPGRLKLTSTGRIALPVALGAFVLALVIQIDTDRETEKATKRSTETQVSLQKKVNDMKTSIDKLISNFISPDAILQQIRLDPSSRQRIGELAKDPIIHERIAPETLQALTELGIPSNILQGAPIEKLAEVQGNVLADKAAQGDALAVKSLLESGVKADYRKEGVKELTPLIYAIMEAKKTKRIDPPGYVEVVRTLLQHHADPNAKYQSARAPNSFTTALWYSSSGGHVEITRMLLSAGADPNKTQTENQYTPLMEAARGGHLDVVKLLLAKGARVDVSGNDGATVCDFAKRGGNKKVLAVLNSYGVCSH